MGLSRFGQIQADAFLGSAHDNSPFGKIWYVDATNGADGNSGESPDEAKSSVAGVVAVMVASRGDTAVFYPGTYTVTSAVVPVAQTTWKAAIVNPQAPTVTIQGNIADLVQIDVSGTRWVGIQFKSTGSTTGRIVDIADGAAVTGVTFEDCKFTGNSNHEVGLSALDGTFAVTGLVVRRCLFNNLGITPLGIGAKGMPLSKIEDNTFAINTASGIGIGLSDTTAVATGHGFVIRQNDFIGTTSTTDVGIKISGVKNTTAYGMIRNNFFANCLPAAVTQDKINSSVVNNYYGGNVGGTLVDPSAAA